MGKLASNLEKAALLLIGLGSEIASEIFKGLDQKEQMRLAQAIKSIKKVDASDMEKVMHEFSDILLNHKPELKGSHGIAQNILNRVPGNNIQLAPISEGRLTATDSMDANAIAGFIGLEHPQTAAIILAYTESSKSAQVIRLLNEQLRTEIIIRIARLEAVADDLIFEIDEALREKYYKASHLMSQKKGGAAFVAKMLGNLPLDQKEQTLEGIRDIDPGLSETISGLMFSFTDLIKINAKGIQELLKHIPAKTLLIALKGISSELADHFLGNMSSRAQKTFREDMEASPKTKLTDVNACQQEILYLAKNLISEGKIILQDENDKYV